MTSGRWQASSKLSAGLIPVQAEPSLFKTEKPEFSDGSDRGQIRDN